MYVVLLNPEAAGVIRKGGLIAFPAGTVYGLGADAENALAVYTVRTLAA